MNSPLVDGLNAPQTQAVLHENGPLLIFAGAGSGKTNVLTRRIAYLIREREVNPYGILAVTFTNRAAAEMKSRIERLVGESATRQLWAGTFHSICVRILRERGHEIGLPRNFVIYDDSDQLSLVRSIIEDMDLDDKKFVPRVVLSQISRAKEKLRAPEDLSEDLTADYFERTIAKIYSRYQQKLLLSVALDFDDLIMRAVELLKTSESAREHYQGRFRFVHCDEFQDVNDSQYKLLALFADKHKNICVVGDDDQSIYAFRGANVRIILNFERDFPGSSVIKLEQNYRSTKTILEAANHVVKNNAGRAPKQLWTENHEGEKITLIESNDENQEAMAAAMAIREGIRAGRNYRDFAILYRTNAQSRVFEQEFTRNSIAYQIVGGVRFYDRREVKDILSYLRAILNPADDVSTRRIINVPAREIGASTVDKIAAFAATQGITFWDACRVAGGIGLSARARNSVQEFVRMMEYLQARRDSLTVVELIHVVVEATKYLEMLEAEKSNDSRARIENVGELMSVAQAFESSVEEDGDRSLFAFLENVALVAGIDNLKDNSNSVTMMTLHSAKGLEFPVVFLGGLEEGIFPNIRSQSDEEKETQEERRLCYVGITRAKEQLYLSYATSRMVFGQTRRQLVSRFLTEIPQALFLPASQRRSSLSSWAPTFEPGRRVSQETVAPRWSEMASRGAPARTQVQTQNRPFRLGEKVKHAKFGTGTVVSYDGDTLINVAFPSPLGIKKLDTNFAKLEKA